jgi:hypothetical protein
MGQSDLAAALLYAMEQFPITPLDLITLFSNPSAKAIIFSLFPCNQFIFHNIKNLFL